MTEDFSLSPEVERLFNRAYELHTAGELREAITWYQQCVEVEPRLAIAWSNLGRCFADLNQHEDALVAYKKAIDQSPFNAEFHLREGLSLRALNRRTEARAAFVFASKLDPNFVDPLLALTTIDEEDGSFETASNYLERALSLIPEESPEDLARKISLLANHAEILTNLHRISDAIRVLEALLARAPHDTNAMLHLATCYLDSLRVDEAHALFDRASNAKLSGRQNSVALMSLLYREDLAPNYISEHHISWGRSVTKSTSAEPSRRTPIKDSDPLRVGYISSDFRYHAISQFILPVISNHSDKVETFLYSNVAKPDALTATFQSKTKHFRSVASLSDNALVEAIRNDNLDLLIELNGHTLGNRLLALAAKPAPILCSWLGYAATTGLPAIDYRFVDGYTDPPGSEPLCSETLVRLPLGFNCFQPVEPLPAVMPLPALSNGYITFGSSNSIRKITPHCLALWAEILRSVPQSRLALKWSSFEDPAVRARALELLRPFGISDDRIVWSGYTKGQSSHLQFYNTVDIALDTFPYNGTTTTCDALSMGVPVVSIYGLHHASRVSLSILSRIGYPEMAVAERAEYVSQAIALASDPQRLATLRSSLRQSLERSALFEHKRFVSAFEETLRSLVVFR
jgi:protein O-GlcNAc transferase